MAQVDVTISPAGKVKFDAVGFEGASCDSATEQLELVLGGGARKRENKPEYHMPSGVRANNKLTF